MSVALVIQQPTRMPHILSSVARLFLPYFSTLSHKRHDSRKRVTEHKMCVLIFYTTFVRDISHSTSRVLLYLLYRMYLLYYVCIAVLHTLDAGLLARSQYSEGPATGHLDTGFSRFPCVYKQMLRRFPTLQVATTCFSCSRPDLNLVVTDFMFCIHVK